MKQDVPTGPRPLRQDPWAVVFDGSRWVDAPPPPVALRSQDFVISGVSCTGGSCLTVGYTNDGELVPSFATAYEARS